MLKQLSPLQVLSQHQRTVSELPAPISKPASPTLNEQQIMAAKAVDRLFDLLPPLDVGEPQAFMSATIAIFAEYPIELIDRFPAAIAQRSDRPTLRLVRAICDEINEPYARETARMLAARSALRGLPPPRAKRTPEEQARVDAQVADFRKALGIPERK